jgi:hypothetical protein
VTGEARNRAGTGSPPAQVAVALHFCFDVGMYSAQELVNLGHFSLCVASLWSRLALLVLMM